MVRHWHGERAAAGGGSSASTSSGPSPPGSCSSASASKIPNGAWIALITPILVGLMQWVRGQYRGQEVELLVQSDAVIPHPHRTQRVVIPVNGINRAVVQAVNVGRALASESAAVYVTDDPEAGDQLRERWSRQLRTSPSSSWSRRTGR